MLHNIHPLASPPGDIWSAGALRSWTPYKRRQKAVHKAAGLDVSDFKKVAMRKPCKLAPTCIPTMTGIAIGQPIKGQVASAGTSAGMRFQGSLQPICCPHCGQSRLHQAVHCSSTSAAAKLTRSSHLRCCRHQTKYCRGPSCIRF